MSSSASDAGVIFPQEDALPEMHVCVNRLYALYHFLAREARLPPDERNAAFHDAARLMAIARFPRDVQGHWSDWEVPLTRAQRTEDISDALIQAMRPTAEHISRAMTEAAPLFDQDVWSAYLPLINEA